MTDDPVRNIDAKESEGSTLTVGKVLALLGLAAFVAFIIQNSQTSNIDFLWLTINLPVWLVGVIIFLIGALIGYYSKSRKVKAKRKALK